MTCDGPGTLCREHHKGCIEGTAAATCQSAGPQVVMLAISPAGIKRCTPRRTTAPRLRLEARGGSEHLVIHAASVSKSVDSTTCPRPPESGILAVLLSLCRPEERSRREDRWQRVSSSRTTTDRWCVTCATPTVAGWSHRGHGCTRLRWWPRRPTSKPVRRWATALGSARGAGWITT